MVDNSAAMVSRTRFIMHSYAHDHDPQWLADDVTFTFSGMPGPLVGRDQVQRVLDVFYHEAFEATSQVIVIASDSEQGLGFLEFIFRGRHIGEFMGLPATGRSVELPMAGIYHIGSNRIRSAHIYFDHAALMQQLLEGGEHDGPN